MTEEKQKRRESVSEYALSQARKAQEKGDIAKAIEWSRLARIVKKLDALIPSRTLH
jgi:hypothetical protein